MSIAIQNIHQKAYLDTVPWGSLGKSAKEEEGRKAQSNQHIFLLVAAPEQRSQPVALLICEAEPVASFG